jgi:hypothetical protein
VLSRGVFVAPPTHAQILLPNLRGRGFNPSEHHDMTCATRQLHWGRLVDDVKFAVFGESFQMRLVRRPVKLVMRLVMTGVCSPTE